MRQQVRARLLEVNRRFYQTFASEFSGSRPRPLPGVERWVNQVLPSAEVLDLGCGNGSLARALHAHGHGGGYLGVDSSSPLLEHARANTDHPAASFLQLDLAEPDWRGRVGGRWDWIFCLAVLHHLPAEAKRLDFVVEAGSLLADSGRLALSVWNLADEPGWETRRVPWSSIGVSTSDVEPGDVLVDWRRGGRGLRYVHLFHEAELEELAQAAGFAVESSHFAGGESGRLNRLQLWRKSGGPGLDLNGDPPRMVESGGSGG